MLVTHRIYDMDNLRIIIGSLSLHVKHRVSNQMVTFDKLTFTALAVSSENGGANPKNIAATERPNTRRVAKTKNLFAPRE